MCIVIATYVTSRSSNIHMKHLQHTSKTLETYACDTRWLGRHQRQAYTHAQAQATPFCQWARWMEAQASPSVDAGLSFRDGLGGWGVRYGGAEQRVMGHGCGAAVLEKATVGGYTACSERPHAGEGERRYLFLWRNRLTQ
jgi:hypothetical protein